MLDNSLKSLDRVIMEFKATTLTEDEFFQICERITLILKTLDQQRDGQSQKSHIAFKAAFNKLQAIRNTNVS